MPAAPPLRNQAHFHRATATPHLRDARGIFTHKGGFGRRQIRGIFRSNRELLFYIVSVGNEGRTESIRAGDARAGTY